MNQQLFSQPLVDSPMAAGVLNSQFSHRSAPEEAPASEPNPRADASQLRSSPHLFRQPLVDSLMASGVLDSQFRNRSTQEETPTSAPNHRADASQPKSNSNKVGGQ